MSTKTLMLFIAALCLVQGIGGESLEEVISDALKKIDTSVTQSAAQDGTNQLQAISHSLIHTGLGILKNSNSVLQNITEELKDAVKKVVGDVPRCVLEQQSAGLKVLEQAPEHLVKCVVVEVEQVGVLIKEVAVLANKTLLLPQQASANITKCMKNPFTAWLCVTKVVGELGSATASISAEINEIVTQGQHLFVSAPGDIAQCAAKEVNNTAGEINKITVAIAQCIVDGSSSTASLSAPSSTASPSAAN